MTLFNSFNLRLFDGEEGAGDTQGVESPLGSQAADTEQLANAQPKAKQVEKTVDKSAEFKKLIKGEYKDVYNKMFKDAINERFKNNKVNEDRLTKAEAILTRVAEMSGNSDTSDLDALMGRLDEIDPTLEDEAVRRGMSVDALREVKKIERQNAQYERQEQARKADEQVKIQMQEWNNQANELKNLYGERFNLDEELKNDEFRGLLEYGYPMQKAFEVCHIDEFVGSAMQYASQNTSKQIAQNITAQGSRPVENGLHNNAPVKSTVDINKISVDDWNKITDLVVQGKVKNANEALKYLQK